MSTKIWTIATALLLVGGPTGTAAQEPSPEQRIEAALAAAVEAGIPRDLLETKVKEGEAKGVPPARIAAAVEARLGALVGAHGILREIEPEVPPRPDEISVAADALQAGVEAGIIRTVHTETPREQRTVAIAVLAQVVRLGLPPDRAALEVRMAVRSGPEELVRLPARVRVRLRGGGGDLDLTRLRLGAIGSTGVDGGRTGLPRVIPLPGEERTRGDLRLPGGSLPM